MEDKKKEFIELLKSTNREGIEDLINWLENESDFFISPASTKYHLSYKGGLLEHSLNVLDQMINQLALDLSDEQITEELRISTVIVSLLHDVCKANYYSEKEKNVKNEKGEWVKEPYFVTDDMYPLGHGEKSVIIIQKYIKLTDDEIMAIRWHMGGFEPKDNYQYLSKAFSKYYLALALHIADLKATYVTENGK